MRRFKCSVHVNSVNTDIVNGMSSNCYEGGR